MELKLKTASTWLIEGRPKKSVLHRFQALWFKDATREQIQHDLVLTVLMNNFPVIISPSKFNIRAVETAPLQVHTKNKDSAKAKYIPYNFPLRIFRTGTNNPIRIKSLKGLYDEFGEAPEEEVNEYKLYLSKVDDGVFKKLDIAVCVDTDLLVAEKVLAGASTKTALKKHGKDIRALEPDRLHQLRIFRSVLELFEIAGEDFVRESYKATWASALGISYNKVLAAYRDNVNARQQVVSALQKKKEYKAASKKNVA